MPMKKKKKSWPCIGEFTSVENVTVGGCSEIIRNIVISSYDHKISSNSTYKYLHFETKYCKGLNLGERKTKNHISFCGYAMNLVPNEHEIIVPDLKNIRRSFK